MLDERTLLADYPDNKIKERISRKLTDWFFNLVKDSSNIIISIFDRPNIEEILSVYMDTGNKLYLSDVDQ